MCTLSQHLLFHEELCHKSTNPGDLERGLRVWGCFCSRAPQSGELAGTGTCRTGRRWQRCWRKGSSIPAFSHENPVGVARGCSSPGATPRYGLRCRSFLWLPFHASGLNILVQQVSLRLVLIQLHLLKCKLGHGGAGSFSCLYLQGEAGEGDQSEQPERRCSPAVSQDAKGKTYPSIPKCQQRSPGNYLLRLLSYLMI